jgi:hypothetical protein
MEEQFVAELDAEEIICRFMKLEGNYEMYS